MGRYNSANENNKRTTVASICTEQQSWVAIGQKRSLGDRLCDNLRYPNLQTPFSAKI